MYIGEDSLKEVASKASGVDEICSDQDPASPGPFTDAFPVGQ